MSDFIFFLIGFALGIIVSAVSIRRAKKKPEGKTAKTVNVIFGKPKGPEVQDGPGPWKPPK